MRTQRPTTPLIRLAAAAALALGGLCAVAAPRIACDQADFNAGEVRTGSRVTHRYTLRNAGDQLLVIHEVKPGCGCTTASLAKRELLPGETTVVDVSLDLTLRRGQQHKQILVLSNDPATPTFLLGLSATSLDDFRLEPEFIDLGQIPLDTPLTRTARLTCTSEKPWRILETVALKNLVRTTVETSADGKVHTLTVTLPAQTMTGSLYDNVQIRTDNPATPVLPLQVVGTVAEALSVGPSPLPVAPSAGPVQRTVTVRGGPMAGGGSRPFRLLRAEFPDPDVRVEMLSPGPLGQQVRLVFPRVDDSLNGKELVLTTDVAGSQTVRVPVLVRPLPPSP